MEATTSILRCTVHRMSFSRSLFSVVDLISLKCLMQGYITLLNSVQCVMRLIFLYAEQMELYIREEFVVLTVWQN